MISSPPAAGTPRAGAAAAPSAARPSPTSRCGSGCASCCCWVLPQRACHWRQTGPPIALSVELQMKPLHSLSLSLTITGGLRVQGQPLLQVAALVRMRVGAHLSACSPSSHPHTHLSASAKELPFCLCAAHAHASKHTGMQDLRDRRHGCQDRQRRQAQRAGGAAAQGGCRPSCLPLDAAQGHCRGLQEAAC